MQENILEDFQGPQPLVENGLKKNMEIPVKTKKKPITKYITVMNKKTKTVHSVPVWANGNTRCGISIEHTYPSTWGTRRYRNEVIDCKVCVSSIRKEINEIRKRGLVYVRKADKLERELQMIEGL